MLVGLAVVLVAVQPLVQRAVARRRPEAAPVGSARRAGLLAGAYVTGTYGGYFGAAQGVLQVGWFGLLLPEPVQRINGVKNVLTTVVNAVAAVAYLVVAPDRVNWIAAALVAVGSLLGGTTGAALGRRLPAPVLRTAIIVIGVVAIVALVRG